VWLLVAPAVAWAVARTAGLERGSLLVQLTAFTPYAAALSAVPLVVALLARNWWATAVAAVACVALTVGVLPRAFGHSATGTGNEARLTVMSVNMRLGLADAVSIVDLVRTHDVDVLTLQEYTPDAQEALGTAGLAALLPYSSRDAIDGAAGSAVYSRLPPSDVALVQGTGSTRPAWSSIRAATP
jgi:hypothetical protein